MQAIDTERSPGLPSLMVTTRRRLMPHGTSCSFLQAVTQALHSMQRSASQRNLTRAMIYPSRRSNLTERCLGFLHARRGIVAIRRQRVDAFAKHDRIAPRRILASQIGAFVPAGKVEGHPGDALAHTLGHLCLHPRPGIALGPGDPDPCAVLDATLGSVRRIDLDVHVLLQLSEPLAGTRFFAAALIFDEPTGTQNKRELLDDAPVDSGLLDGEADVRDPKLPGVRPRWILADEIGPRRVNDFAVHRDRIRQIPGDHARLAIAIGAAAVLDRDTLDTARKIERPGDGIGIGCVYPLDDLHLGSGEILVPAEPLEDAERELRITILDFRAGRVGAFGEQVVMIFLFDLLSIFHDLARDHALNPEAGAECPTAFLYRQIGVVEYR